MDFHQRNLQWRSKVEHKRLALKQDMALLSCKEQTFKPQVNAMSEEIHRRKMELLQGQQDPAMYYQASALMAANKRSDPSEMPLKVPNKMQNKEN